MIMKPQLRVLNDILFMNNREINAINDRSVPFDVTITINGRIAWFLQN